jgi:hypothetical protein
MANSDPQAPLGEKQPLMGPPRMARNREKLESLPVSTSLEALYAIDGEKLERAGAMDVDPGLYELQLERRIERLERALGQLSIAVQGPQPTLGGPRRDPDLLAIATEQTPPMKTDAEYLEERGR